MQFFVECLLQWDPKKQKAKGKGIVGTVLAFAPADEEQGRKTLHSHWQIWTEELNQEKRDGLFSNDKEEREKARKDFCRHIDEIMNATYGSELTVTHMCKQNDVDTPVTGSVQDIFQEKEDQVLRNGRHKNLCHDIGGKVMECRECKSEVSTTDIVKLSLESCRQRVLNDGTDSRPDCNLPMSSERMDMAAYTYSYHMDGGCIEEKDPFWGNKDIRSTLLRLRFDEHDSNHKTSCFKKSCECRFLFPFKSSQKTYIHPEYVEDDKNAIEWHCLKGPTMKVAPWMIIPQRPMGCQFINTHNVALSAAFNCNTNIQVGDTLQVYYSTLYNSKNTQKEDSERQQRVSQTIIRRLLRKEEDVLLGKCRPEDVQDGFVEGLCMMLGGMNAATSRDVISTTMSHLLACNGGSRFKMSHGYGVLLIGQLEATLEGKPVDVRLRSNLLKGEKVLWEDSTSEDYIHRPTHEDIESLCSYEMTMYYRKICKTFKEMKKTNQQSSANDDKEDDNGEDESDDDDECVSNRKYFKLYFSSENVSICKFSRVHSFFLLTHLLL